MVLDKANVELLKLVAVCKDVSCEHKHTGVNLLGNINVDRLIREGLLYVSRDGRYYRATQVGYDLLNTMGYGYQSDTFRESHKHVLERRDITSQVMTTLLLAGVDVFADNVSGLMKTQSYLAVNHVRRVQLARKQNLTNNTRFVGIMNGFVFYYVSDPNGILFYRNENKVAMDMIIQAYRASAGEWIAGAVQEPAVVYMGADYPSLCAAVTGPVEKGNTYRSAYDSFKQPVYLCPCNPDGAFQMRVMLQPDYRERLIRILFPDGWETDRVLNFGGCDGLFNGELFVIGVDMDLRRMTGVVRAARKRGVNTHIFARQCQCDAIRGAFPGKDILLYRFEDSEIMDAFSFSTFLLEPSGQEPYYTKEGRCVGDADIHAHREARKTRRKDGKADKEGEG